MTIDVSIDADGMRRRLTATPAQLLAAGRRALPKIAQLAVGEMRGYLKDVYRGYQKGPLAASIRAVVAGNELRVGPSVPYAAYVNNGFRDFFIFPRNARALHWKSGREDVFAKMVHHPGFEGHRFIEATAEQLPPLAEESLRRALVAEMQRRPR